MNMGDMVYKNGALYLGGLYFNSDEEKNAFVEYLDVQPSQGFSTIVVDLPVSDGTDVSSGYAYIDSSSRCVKVKE